MLLAGQFAKSITNSDTYSLDPGERTSLSSRLGTEIAGAVRIPLAKAKGFLYSFWINRRLKWGLLVLLILAPASGYIYLLFPESGFGADLVSTPWFTIPNFIETDLPVTEGGTWYYMKIRYWAMSSGNALSPVLAIYGIFLLFPKGYYPSYIAGVPFGYYLSILVQKASANSYGEYHSGFGPGVISMLVVLGVIIFIVSDKILFNQNHRKRATEARIIGLINTPGMDWKKKEKLLKKEAKDWMKNDNELFNRTG